MQSFIFGKGQEYASPEELAKARALAEAMLGPQRAPQNVGEGLTALGYALRGRMDMNRINKAEKAGRESAGNAIAKALGGLGGGSPAAPSASVSGALSKPIAGGEAIRAGLVKRGLPEYIADAFVMNFKDESGLNPGINEASPIVPGSRGGFGLAQWTGPRRKALEAFAAERGVPVSDTDAQLDFLMSELQGSEANAAKSIMAAPDTGSAAAAIVNNFLRPAEEHRAAREARYRQAGGGQQVASLDPSIGMPSAPSGVAAALQGPPQQQVAQALGANNPGNIVDINGKVATGNFPPPPPAPAQQTAQSGPDLNTLLEAAKNPWLNEQERSLVNMLLEQKMRESDPARQLEMEKARLQIDQLKNPKADPFTLSPGEIRFGPDGKQIATGGEKPRDLPAAVQEYEYAKEQGFPGTFQDWEASKKGGMSLQVDPATGAVTFQQGNNIKPLTEGQSKDTVFTTRAEGALPLIDRFGNALTSLPETVGGQVPGVGNYMKSPEFQQAEQAGKEFLQAILRKDTGAAITAEETAEYGSVYLPRPGDSPQLLEQKKASRIRALEAIKAGMPAQAILMQEKALSNTNKKAPMVIDGYTIEEIP